jgi:hypothetical protein
MTSAMATSDPGDAAKQAADSGSDAPGAEPAAPGAEAAALGAEPAALGAEPAALAGALLDSLESRPLAEHPDAYEQVHKHLSEALASIDDA